jgi:hypothetical protein
VEVMSRGVWYDNGLATIGGLVHMVAAKDRVI